MFVRSDSVLFGSVLCLGTFSWNPMVVLHIRVNDKTFVIPVSCYVVVWESAVRTSTSLFRRHLNPIMVVVTNATNSLRRSVTVVIATVHEMAAMGIKVVFQSRATPTSPALIPGTRGLSFPYLVPTVFPT